MTHPGVQPLLCGIPRGSTARTQGDEEMQPQGGTRPTVEDTASRLKRLSNAKKNEWGKPRHILLKLQNIRDNKWFPKASPENKTNRSHLRKNKCQTGIRLAINNAACNKLQEQCSQSPGDRNPACASKHKHAINKQRSRKVRKQHVSGQ